MSLSMVFYVGLGGFVGTVLRYLMGTVISSYFASVTGLATFVVDFMGSFFIAYLDGLSADRLSAQMLTILSVGLFGGFTTYSAFSNETLNLIKEGRVAYATSYVLVMVAACLLASYLGFLLSQKAA